MYKLIGVVDDVGGSPANVGVEVFETLAEACKAGRQMMEEEEKNIPSFYPGTAIFAVPCNSHGTRITGELVPC